MEYLRRNLLRLALLTWTLFHCAAAQQSSVLLSSRTEWTALIDLRGSLGVRSVDWPIKADPCTSWKGIQCNGNGRVTGINIYGFRRTRIGRSNPGFTVDSLANLTSLEIFNASKFPLPGSIPDWFGSRLGSSLRVLDLRSSSVTGPIPTSLGELAQLNALHLSENELVGPLPAELGKLRQISVLDLSRNLLTGSIPEGLASLANLSRLNLSSNYISGSIPLRLGNASRLQFLDLSDNSLTGFIPDGLGSLSQLVELNLSKNSLSGYLSSDLVSRFGRLQVVNLSGNKFEGTIPSTLWALPDLQLVDLSVNNFTGDVQIFTFNGNASKSIMFNLSNNLLYGTLAASSSSLVDLSGNYIQGKIPTGIQTNVILNSNCLRDVSGQRSLADCRLFYDERGLSFDNFGAASPAPAPFSSPGTSKRWIYILVGVLVGIGFIALMALLMVLCIRKFDKNGSSPRGSANVGPVPEGDKDHHPAGILSDLGESFTYDQLRRLACEKNLIKNGRSGDLFQAFLGEGAPPIVVKRVDAKKESLCMMELEFFSKYSHARLVPLLGQCLENENEKFLVYKYMPNGDLASSLYRVVISNGEEDSLQSLDWITRLKIAIGAAEGLCFLHHECNPPVVHRDVQASSILLDDKFEVRLGSLSEIRVQEGELHHSKIITRFLRKQLSSESGSSGALMATCSYDVYCFGKVLLELVTGKLGVSSKSEDPAMRDWLDHTLGYISIYDKDMMTKIVDPSLIVDEDLLEEVWAMAIVARSCLNPKPSKRPPMKYILKALENSLKVVREENYHSSGRLRTTSSRRSWSTAFFGSWRHGSGDNASVLNHATAREYGITASKHPVESYGSGRIEYATFNKRLSNDIFPEPPNMQDIERHEPEIYRTGY